MRVKWIGIVAALAVTGGAQAIVNGQIDTFSSDIASWSGAAPTWISTGGTPAGYLQLTSSGGSGSGGRMAGFNTAQWSGNFATAGVTSIGVDMENTGQNQVEMRLTFFALDSTQWVSNNSLVLNPGSGWVHVNYALNAGNFTSSNGGATSFASTMTGVIRMMLRHDPLPVSSTGVPIVAQIGIDNVQAVPEPASLTAVGLGLVALLRRRASRAS
jgi:hypothetical protein